MSILSAGLSILAAQDQVLVGADDILSIRQDSWPVEVKDSLLSVHLDLAKQRGDDSLAAYIQHSLGYIYFGAERFEEALPHYARAFEMWRALPDTQYVNIMRSGLWAGMSAFGSEKLDTAKAYYREILTYPRHRYKFMAYRDMASIMSAEGDYEKAGEYFRQAHLGHDLLLPGDRIQLQLEVMKMRYEQKNLSTFHETIAESERLLVELASDLQKVVTDRNLSSYFQNLALLCRFVGHTDRCKTYNLKALEYAVTSWQQAHILNNLANLLREIGEVDSAHLYLIRARRIYDTLDGLMHLEGLASTSDNLGEISLVRDDYAQAQLHFDSALFFKTGSFYSGVKDAFTAFSAEQKMSVAVYLADKARGYYQWYQAAGDKQFLSNALQCYSDADQMIDLIRRSLAHDDAHIHWRGQARDIYVPAVQVAIEAGERETALRFIDRSKALVLTEALQKSHNAEIIPPVVRQAEAQLARQINTAEQKVRKLEAGTDDAILMRMRDTLLELQGQYVALNDRILQDYPDYFPTYNFDISEVQREMPDSMCILSYFLTPDTVICARVDRHAVDVRSLCSRVQLDALLDTLHDLWTDMEHGAAVGNAMSGSEYKDHLKTLAATCSALHEALLKPWGELPQRVMIIGDGRLNGLNFELLLTDKPDAETPLRRWPFAIQKHCFSYNHSIANWREMIGNESRIRQVVGIAPEFESPYQALPHSQKGLEDIRGFRLNILRGSEANRSRLAQHGRRTILDFQTHAVINEDHSEGSFIVLNNEDGRMDSLYLSDIYHFDFSGSFAVLTACETHVGEVARGEGVISLARAFTYAGASGMITSLWKVDDLVSSQILHRMYQGLSSGLEKDVALNQAKLLYLDNTQDERQEHPFYWASVVPLGSTAPVSDSGNWPLMLFGVFLGGLFAWVVSGSVKSHPVPNAA